MLCSRFLKVVTRKKGSARLMDRAFDALHRGYARSLRLVLRHRLVMLVVRRSCCGRRAHVRHRAEGLHPRLRQRRAVRQLRAAQGTSFYEMVDYVERSPTAQRRTRTSTR
jgi:multidrug efflux pump